jgi:hypothetical protein
VRSSGPVRIANPGARRSENSAESTTGIIPGDRGKDGGSWCRHPLLFRASGTRQAQSPVPLAGVMTGQSHDKGAERLGAIRNRPRAESGGRNVSIRPPTQLPRGFRLLLRRPERSRVSRRDDPAKRPRAEKTDGARKGGAAARRERARQSPSNLLIGRSRQAGSPNCKANAA